MTFSSTVMPLMRLNCWNTKPKVRRRISVRNRSGRLVSSRSPRKIRPEVGLAMQPARLSRVVLPEPLGPCRAVTVRAAMVRVTVSTATKALVRPAL